MKLLLILTLINASASFTTNGAERRNLVKLDARRESASGMARFFGLATAASILSFQVADASASTPDASTPFFSSSVQVAEQIKTLDFSLPSSYDSISDAKASVANVEDLAQPLTRSSLSTRTTAPAIKSDDGDSGPGVIGSFLPSMNKSGPKTSSAASSPAKDSSAKATKASMPSYNF